MAKRQLDLKPFGVNKMKQTSGSFLSESNTHLIAAAPELFEACLAALAAIKDAGIAETYYEDVEILEKAIAKARGESLNKETK